VSELERSDATEASGGHGMTDVRNLPGGAGARGPGARGPGGDNSPDSSYVRVCALADVPEDGALGVEVSGTPVAIIRAGGEIFALHDVCSHEEVPLSEGDIYDHTVECWLHGSCFDLRTGEPTGPPATRPVATYPVLTYGDDVYVSLPEQEK
jgi:3-phenylpropionate/trans-cinnamate dioxygenase ferredoxin component